MARHKEPIRPGAGRAYGAMLVLLLVSSLLVAFSGASAGREVGISRLSDEASVSRISHRAAARADRYWTDRRMASATPYTLRTTRGSADEEAPAQAPARDVSVVAGSAPALTRAAPNFSSHTVEGYWSGSSRTMPARAIGKMFFVAWDPLSRSYQNFVCSGSVVGAENGSVVWTAAHCLYDTVINRWHTNVRFCPGYNPTRGCNEFGTWTQRIRSVPTAYINSIGCSYTANGGTTCDNATGNLDNGAMAVYRINNVTLQAWVGAHTLGLNSWYGYRYAFGYPRNKNSGWSLYVCQARNTVAHNHLLIPCTATGGSSGGPWISNPSSAWIGTVYSVNSHGNSTVMHGPYQGQAALNVYNAVRNA